MKNSKQIGIALLMLLTVSSGCGSRAVYLQSGTVCILEKSVTVVASVPGADGKLIPGTSVNLPAGTEFRYGGSK